MEILIKNPEQIYTINEKGKLESPDSKYIEIAANKIVNVGNELDIYNSEDEYTEVFDAENRVVLPGLINTHTHSSMNLLRGYADDLPLDRWLEEKIWPLEARLGSEDIYWGAMLAITEMITMGTTTLNDMYFQMDRVAEAVRETGFRAVLSQGLIEENDGDRGLTEAKEFTERWQGQAAGRITTMLGPHAPYTCSDNYLEQVANLAGELEVPINIHVAETKGEVSIIQQQYGLTPVKLLEKTGILSRPILAAHCVHVDEEDRQLLAENEAGISYNPSSNAKLGSGIAPIVDLLERGVAVGLGTDSVASNNNLDLFEEARMGAYLQKAVNQDPTVINLEEILRMLTTEAAGVLHLNNLGRIATGYLADIILIDVEDITHYPHHNHLSNIFYAGSGFSVKSVIVNGRPLMKEGQLLTVDQARVKAKVREWIAKLT